MWEKLKPYKKLIYSQICALLGIMSLVLAIIRHAQIGDWSEQMTSSFLLFAACLFIAEIRFLYLWLKESGKIGKKHPA